MECGALRRRFYSLNLIKTFPFRATAPHFMYGRSTAAPQLGKLAPPRNPVSPLDI
jgi:hypothetical protein